MIIMIIIIKIIRLLQVTRRDMKEKAQIATPPRPPRGYRALARFMLVFGVLAGVSTRLSKCFVACAYFSANMAVTVIPSFYV